MRSRRLEVIEGSKLRQQAGGRGASQPLPPHQWNRNIITCFIELLRKVNETTHRKSFLKKWKLPKINALSCPGPISCISRTFNCFSLVHRLQYGDLLIHFRALETVPGTLAPLPGAV